MSADKGGREASLARRSKSYCEFPAVYRGIIPGGGGGGGGLAKLPACRPGELVAIQLVGCAAAPVNCVRPPPSRRHLAVPRRRCAAASPMTWPGAIAGDPGRPAAGGGGGMLATLVGSWRAGKKGRGPGGVPVGRVSARAEPGRVRCADAGAAIAAGIIATPLKRWFMSLILCCSSG